MAPRDVGAGSVWDEAILDAIERSRVFLLILSNHANQSQFVKNEVNRAFSQSKPIVTFRLEDVMPGRSLELYLARHHWTDAFPPPLGARVDRLASSITALLSSASPNAERPAGTAPLQGNHALGSSSAITAVRPPRAAQLLSSVRMMGKSAHILAKRPLIAWASALLIGALIAGFAVWNLKPVPVSSKPVSRFTITPPRGLELQVLNGSSAHALALSPDGTRLVYVGSQGGTEQLFLRTTDSTEIRPISGTEQSVMPFFSPDSQWVGFFTMDGKLKKVSVSGGAAITICDLETRVIAGASWGSQGTIVLGNVQGPLSQVSDAGGTPQPMTHLAKEERGQVWPEFLPGGKSVLFATGTPGGSQIAVFSIATGERRDLLKGTDPRYAASGHLVFIQGSTLMAAAFDLRHTAVTGAAVPIIEGVLQNTVGTPINAASDYAISATGSLVFVPASAQSAPLRLVWVSRNGVEQPLPVDPHDYTQPRISPDGHRIAVGITEKESQIWMYDLSRGTLTRFTFEGTNNGSPFWTPDGKRIVFISNKAGPRNLFWQLADGSGGLERLTTSEYLQIPGSWSPGRAGAGLFRSQSRHELRHLDVTAKRPQNGTLPSYAG